MQGFETRATRGFGMGMGAIGSSDGFDVAEGALRRLVGEPSGGEPLWREALDRRLGALADAIEDHVRETEACDGLLNEIVLRAPRLRDRVDRLQAEHAEIRAGCAALRARLRDGAPPEALRGEARALLDRCDRHRHRSADLIFASFGVDLGGG